MVEEGKAEGSISRDVDSEQVTGNSMPSGGLKTYGLLMGLDQFVTAGRSSTILANILGRLSDGAIGPKKDDEIVKLKRLLELCPLVNASAE